MINRTDLHTWVVVADNHQVTVYKSTQFPKLEEVIVLRHPEGRLHNQDLTSSEPGRNFQRGGVTRHSYQPKTEPTQVVMEKFAVEISNFLTKSLNEEKFNRLFIISSPSLLGELRRHITPQVKKLIKGELAKNLSSSDLSLIEQHYSEM